MALSPPHPLTVSSLSSKVYVQFLHSMQFNEDFPFVIVTSIKHPDLENKLNADEELTYERQIFVLGENSTASVSNKILYPFIELVEMGFCRIYDLSGSKMPRMGEIILFFQNYPGLYISSDGSLRKVFPVVNYPICTTRVDSETVKFKVALPSRDCSLYIEVDSGMDHLIFPFSIDNSDTELGTIWLPGEEPREGKIDIVDNEYQPVSAIMIIDGRVDTPDQDIGYLSNPFCSANRCLTEEGSGIIELLPVEYIFISFHGMGRIDYEDVTIAGGEKVSL